MNKKILIFLVIKLLFYRLSFADIDIYYVTKNGDDNSSGTSWQTAFKTISKALSIAHCDKVFVAEGVYKEGDTILNLDYLYGGFDGTETDPSQRRILEHPTIIDGENSYTCVNNRLYIDGFHITNGKESIGAGGIYNDDLSATVVNCIVYGNSASGYELVGGIANRTGKVINCIVYNNYNNTFCGGIGNDTGGEVIHCTMYANQGGGLLNYGYVYNSVSWNNDTYDYLPYSWSEFGMISHSCFGEAYPKDGNIRGNPLFANTSGDPSTWNFRLKKGSSCIDAGTHENTWESDIEGSLRPGNDNKVCMGAFESPDEYITGISTNPSKKLYVSKTGLNTDGNSWEDAFTSITTAIDNTPGDELWEIWVAKGTYKEHDTIQVLGRINLYGGFEGNETYIEERHITQNQTIIHGEESYQCIHNNGYVDGFYIGKRELIDYLLGRRIITSGNFPYADRNSDDIIDIGDLLNFILSFPTPTPIP